MAITEALPENLRCNRTDGRQWRCNRRVMEDKKLCEIHYLQGRHRQHKQKVPDSLKLERKRNKAQNQENGENKKGGKMVKKKKGSAGDSLDESLRKLKLRRGDSQFDLIREFLKAQLEKKEREMEQRHREKEILTTELQNGAMAITPSPISQEFYNLGSCNVKLGLNCSSFQKRSFRSKNAEPMPISTVQSLPSVRDAMKLGRGKRNKCHSCLRSNFRALVQCTSCQKQFFCEDCIEESHPSPSVLVPALRTIGNIVTGDVSWRVPRKRI